MRNIIPSILACIVSLASFSSSVFWEQENTPLRFTENKGQVASFDGSPVPFVLFETNMNGLDLYITTSGLTYVFTVLEEDAAGHFDRDHRKKTESNSMYTWCRMDMNLKNAAIKKENIVAEGILPGFDQYFLPHCPGGIKNVKSYTDITITDIYPSIDWKIYTDKTNGQSLKYDFILHPGANPNDIKLIYEGAGNLSVNNNSIQISTPIGVIQEGEVKTYTKGHRENVSSLVQIQSKQETTIHLGSRNKNRYEVSFHIPHYDKSKTLVIDPPLSWSTFYGGPTNTTFYSIKSDNQNIYVSGTTNASGFPTLDPGSGAYYDVSYAGGFDLVIVKFGVDGVRKWATYYGGGNEEDVTSKSLSLLEDQIWIVGKTTSANFPTLDAGGSSYYQSTIGGGTYDAFILKFDTTGDRIMATYFGGSSEDHGHAVSTKDSSVWIVGYSTSSDFPFQDPGGGAYYDTVINNTDIFITRLDSSGENEWTTFYGANNENIGYSIHVDDHVWVTGHTDDGSFPVLDPGGGAYYQSSLSADEDAFILKFDIDGVREWATYFGGNNDDIGKDIHASGKWIWMVGYTESTQPSYPSENRGGSSFYDGTRNGSRDGMVAQFDTAGVQVWTIYFGGSNSDEVTSVTGNDTTVWFTGLTYAGSSSFPAYDPGDGGFYEGDLNQSDNSLFPDVFLAQFDTASVREWVTFFGGTNGDAGYGVYVDTSYMWLTGNTNGSSFPLTDLGGSSYYVSSVSGTTDGFISRFGPINAVTPVEWLSFNAAVVEEKKVLTEWSTATEVNNDYFTVLRSSDGIYFDPIGYVNGAGNSADVLEYSFMDYEPLPGRSYYQLQQTDFDGQYDRSQVVPVYISSPQTKIVVYPNPASDKQLSVHFSKRPSEPISIKLTNSLGATCYTKQFDVSTFENNELILHLPSTLSSGLYYLTLFSEHFLHSESVVYETK